MDGRFLFLIHAAHAAALCCGCCHSCVSLRVGLVGDQGFGRQDARCDGSGVKGLPMKLGMEMAAEMIAKIKDEHLCDGVHIMAIGAEKNVPAILDLAGITI